MLLSKSAILLLLAAPVFSSDSTLPPADGLRVHEWGTFTSVAGQDGGPQVWTPLAGPPDLPCFVQHLGGECIKCAPGTPATQPLPTLTSTVRMETPVLYFYSPKRTTLSVKVDFPQGWITEWYPRASMVWPEIPSSAQPLPPLRAGHIEWRNVVVSPGLMSGGPTGTGPSRYYAARHTDAVPLVVSGQPEKFIFYRGIANFAVPLWARLAEDGTLELTNHGDSTLPLAIVFENRGGRIGYRVAHELSGTVRLGLPEGGAGLDGLKAELNRTLIDMGLYPKEAAAMLETWGDSWFEEGLRVIYLMPRRAVDAVLPLDVRPAPEATERVFVGRVEVLSPHVRQTLETALTAGDTATLRKFGRFLQPFADRIPGARTANAATDAFFRAADAEARRQFYSPECIR